MLWYAEDSKNNNVYFCEHVLLDEIKAVHKPEQLGKNSLAPAFFVFVVLLFSSRSLAGGSTATIPTFPIGQHLPHHQQNCYPELARRRKLGPYSLNAFIGEEDVFIV